MKIKATMSCLLLFSFSCRSDKGITVFNPDPEAEITSHSEGDEVLEGYPILLEGHVGDANHSAEQLTVKWKNNGEVLCEASVPQADGSTFCEAIFSASTTKITLEVKDSDGGLGITEPLGLIVVPAQPPVCSISTPLEEGVYYSDQLISFSGSITDAEDNPELLSGYWKSNIDGVLSDVEVTPDTFGDVQGYGYLSEGEHAIELHGEDAIGLPCSDSVMITVGPPNVPPTNPSISLVPPLAMQSQDDLTCMITEESSDITAVSYTIVWFVDGQEWTGTTETTYYSGDTIPTEELEIGEEWDCRVIASDGIAESEEVQSNAVEILRWFDFVPIVADSFVMGGDPTSGVLNNLNHYHNVTLTNNFEMMTTEVTQGMYLYLQGENPSQNLECGMDCPVDTVNWYDAVHLANLLSSFFNVPSCYVCNSSESECALIGNPYSCEGYRLPNEAEWEYVARSGTELEIWTPNGGSDLPDGHAEIHTCTNPILEDGTALEDLGWFCSNAEGSTQPVATKIVNDFGLYDMFGNVWEWVNDTNPSTVSEDAVNPVFTQIHSGERNIVRGGYAGEAPRTARAQERYSTMISEKFHYNGFRLAQTIPQLGNTLPTAPVVITSPESPAAEEDDLRCEVTQNSLDSDGDTVEYWAVWYVNNQLWTGPRTTTSFTYDTIPAENLIAGQTWYCYVTPSDGKQWGAPATSTAQLIE